jgi:hypothetical protein
MELGGDAEISHHLVVHVSQHLSINPLFPKHLHILAHANALQQLLYLQHCQRYQTLFRTFLKLELLLQGKLFAFLCLSGCIHSNDLRKLVQIIVIGVLVQIFTVECT